MKYWRLKHFLFLFSLHFFAIGLFACFEAITSDWLVYSSCSTFLRRNVILFNHLMNQQKHRMKLSFLSRKKRTKNEEKKKTATNKWSIYLHGDNPNGQLLLFARRNQIKANKNETEIVQTESSEYKCAYVWNPFNKNQNLRINLNCVNFITWISTQINTYIKKRANNSIVSHLTLSHISRLRRFIYLYSSSCMCYIICLCSKLYEIGKNQMVEYRFETTQNCTLWIYAGWKIDE